MSEDSTSTKSETDGPKSFENLEVFQRAYRVSLDVHRVSLKFPDIEQRAIADQIRSDGRVSRFAPTWPKVSVSKRTRRPSLDGSFL